jgi:hypothetical protein
VAIALAHVSVCHIFGCSPLATSASSIALTAPGTGYTTVSVYLEDVAGNASAANAATGTFTLIAPPDPPPSRPDPPAPPAKTTPVLRLGLIEGPARVRVRLRTNERLSGVARMAIRWRIGQDPAKRRWSTAYRRQVTIRSGQGSISLRRPARARLVRLVATYNGDPKFNSATSQRTTRLH